MFGWFKKNKDINEPVISFVELVKNNPNRFRLNLNKQEVKDYINEWRKPLYEMYVLFDRQEKEYFALQVFYEETHFISEITYSYLTPEECQYIYLELRPVFQERLDKLNEIKTERKIRDDKRKRQRDIEKYCK